MSRFTKPIDKQTARAFLRELANDGLLFHPEDGAAGCLGHRNLPPETITEIDQKMAATFDHLEDPCEAALEMLEPQSN